MQRDQLELALKVIAGDNEANVSYGQFCHKYLDLVKHPDQSAWEYRCAVGKSIRMEACGQVALALTEPQQSTIDTLCNIINNLTCYGDGAADCACSICVAKEYVKCLNAKS